MKSRKDCPIGLRVRIKPTGRLGIVTGYLITDEITYMAIKVDGAKHTMHWELPSRVVEALPALMQLAECAK